MEGIGRGRARGKRIINPTVFQLPPVLRADSELTLTTSGRGFLPESSCCFQLPPPNTRVETLTKLEARETDPEKTLGRHKLDPEELVTKSVVSLKLDPEVITKPAEEVRLKYEIMPQSEERDQIGLEKTEIKTQHELKPKSAGRGRLLEKLIISKRIDDDKKALKQGLSDLLNTEKGCIVHLTLDYFINDNDVQFFVDTVFEHIKTPNMAQIIGMNLKLLTSINKHGVDIKTKIFTKLQRSYEKLPAVEDLKNPELVRVDETTELEWINLCYLMGQLYFRFRPSLDNPTRYNVLAKPTARCMLILLNLRGTPNLMLLVKLLKLNLTALRTEANDEMDELCVEIHRSLLDEKSSQSERAWLLCASDHLTSGLQGNHLPHKLPEFYQEVLGEKCWSVMAEQEHVQMLADIPPEIMSSAELTRFDLDVVKYNSNKYVAL